MGTRRTLWPGGHLRDLTAAFLDEAAPVLRTDTAAARRAAAEHWRGLAELALPVGVPEFARLRELTAAVHESVVAGGDAGRADAAEASAALWALRGELDGTPPLAGSEPSDLFAALGAQLAAVHAAEAAAVGELAALRRRVGVSSSRP